MKELESENIRYMISIENDTYFSKFIMVIKAPTEEEAVTIFLRRYRRRVRNKLGPEEPNDKAEVRSRLTIVKGESKWNM